MDVATPQRIFLVFKCLPVLSLIIYVYQKLELFGGDERRKSSEGIGIFIGLCLSVMGDALLVYEEDITYFTAGLSSFLLAHVLYMNAFGWKDSRLPVLAVCLTVAFASIYLIFIRFGNISDITLKISCMVYTIVIYLMVWRSWARINFSAKSMERRHILAGVGSLSFVLSDGILAVNKFVLPLPGACFCILATYYTAQTFIALSVPHKVFTSTTYRQKKRKKTKKI